VSALVLEIFDVAFMYEDLIPIVAFNTKVATLNDVAPLVAIFNGVAEVSP
jgi:hypothetical protein